TPCRDTTKGQTYVRSTNDYHGKIAMVYAWYMPKDQVDPVLGIGHRHDWEGAVVYLDKSTQAFAGVAFSAHGHWRKYLEKDLNWTHFQGTHVKAQYSAEPWINSHAVDLTDKDGDLPDLAQWARLGGPAQQAINNIAHWGDTEPPISQRNYSLSLERSWMW
ncbi:hypothetical protein MPER_12714, partial [Moniliophthora perniciosa FA553]